MLATYGCIILTWLVQYLREIWNEHFGPTGLFRKAAVIIVLKLEWIKHLWSNYMAHCNNVG